MVNHAADIDHGNMTLDTRDEWPPDTPVGRFDIEVNGVQGYPAATGHIIFVCPNDRRCSVLLGPQAVGRPAEGKLCIWAWDGNRERPTIMPSINCRATKDDGTPAGGCGWHGFIRNGVIA